MSFSLPLIWCCIRISFCRMFDLTLNLLALRFLYFCFIIIIISLSWFSSFQRYNHDGKWNAFAWLIHLCNCSLCKFIKLFMFDLNFSKIVFSKYKYVKFIFALASKWPTKISICLCVRIHKQKININKIFIRTLYARSSSCLSTDWLLDKAMPMRWKSNLHISASFA